VCDMPWCCTCAAARAARPPARRPEAPEWPIVDDQGERWSTGGPILWLVLAVVLLAVVFLGVVVWGLEAWPW
jgi:hypothetical protein